MTTIFASRRSCPDRSRPVSQAASPPAAPNGSCMPEDVAAGDCRCPESPRPQPAEPRGNPTVEAEAGLRANEGSTDVLRTFYGRFYGGPVYDRRAAARTAADSVWFAASVGCPPIVFSSSFKPLRSSDFVAPDRRRELQACLAFAGQQRRCMRNVAVNHAVSMQFGNPVGQFAETISAARRGWHGSPCEQLQQWARLDEFRRGQCSARVIDNRKHRHERGVKHADDSGVEMVARRRAARFARSPDRAP